MNKWVQCAFAIMIGLGLVFGMANWLNQNGLPGPVADIVGFQGVNRTLVPCLAYYEEPIATDKFIILVDLSDNGNYPHAATNKIILKSVRVAGNLSAAMHWYYNIGVVTAVSDNGTTIEWIHGAPVYRAMFFDERWQLPEHGLSLLVTGGELENVATVEILNTVSITTSTVLSTTVSDAGGVVGVGDLIFYTNEISDTATLDVVVSVGYDTE